MPLDEPDRLFHGHWWLAGDPGTRLPGTLQLREDDAAVLRLIGSFPENPGLVRPQVILGDSTYSRRVSLHHCEYRGGPWGPTDQVHQSTYLAPVTYVGAHFDRPDDVHFGAFTWQMGDLFQWLRPGDYLRTTGRDQGVTIESAQTSGNTEARADIGPALLTLIATGPTIESDSMDMASGGRVVVSQGAWARLEIPNYAHVDEYFRLAFVVRNLFSMIFDARVDVTEATGYLAVQPVAPGERQSHQPPVRIYASGLRDTTLAPRTHVLGGLFGYPDMAGGEFEDLMRKWVTHSQTHESVHELFQASTTNNQLPATVRFFQLAEAVESYQRDRYGGQYEPDENFTNGIYAALRAAIPQGIERGYRDAVVNRLKYLHQYSLRKRVESLVRSLPLLQRRFIPNAAAFADDVATARNYLAHHDQSQREAFERLPLRLLTDYLDLTLKLHFLVEIGFTEEELEALLGRHWRYGQAWYWSRYR